MTVFRLWEGLSPSPPENNTKERPMKKHGTTVILLLVLIAGLSLLLYPTLANWWNSMTQSRAVASYVEAVANINEEQYAHLWDDAWNYNRSLNARTNAYVLSQENLERAMEILAKGIAQYQREKMLPTEEEQNA
jgi:sortase A